jgi:hypothetical protein
MLSKNNFLKRLVALFDNGVVAGNADIAALELEFGPMLRLEQWLAGPGKVLFENALNAEAASIELR